MPKMPALRARVLEISRKHGLSHVGSNLSAVEILDEIYSLGEVVVSSGHAGLAYYIIREKYDGFDAEEQLDVCGVHCQIYGSLGHGLPIAVGKALANRKKQIYCLTSDGEWMEGSMWEALRIAHELKLKNLHIVINANGYGGLKRIDRMELLDRIISFITHDMFPIIDFRFTTTYPLKGLEAHYEKVV